MSARHRARTVPRALAGLTSSPGQFPNETRTAGRRDAALAEGLLAVTCILVPRHVARSLETTGRRRLCIMHSAVSSMPEQSGGS
jgi:hypothetical protein